MSGLSFKMIFCFLFLACYQLGACEKQIIVTKPALKHLPSNRNSELFHVTGIMSQQPRLLQTNVTTVVLNRPYLVTQVC